MQAQHNCAVTALAVSNDDLKLAVSTAQGTLGPFKKQKRNINNTNGYQTT